MKAVNVREATHVKHEGGLEKIVSKWGIDAEGHLEPPSRGGFGVVTESGARVDMWHGIGYYVEEPPTTLKYHSYLSTACYHQRCEDCRLTCKFCSAVCLCSCHDVDREKKQ
jgi:hypothetical protein